MRKTKRNSRATQCKNDEKFAKKVICQFVICTFIFIIIFANSKLSNTLSGQINNQIKYYLYASVDFDKAINTAKAYLENFMNNQDTVQVNTVDDSVSEEDNQ